MSIIFGKPCFSLEDFEREMEEFLPAPDDINFLVHFEIDENNYDGSFGFDWMRNEYKHICPYYAKLKEEYRDCNDNTLWKPQGREYFIPWVALRKGQKNVKLKISIERLNTLPIEDTDTIQFTQQNGISFSVADINVKEIINKGFVEVELYCNTVSEKDRLYKVFDGKGNIVGKLNIFRNKTTYQLDVRFVEVKFKGRVTQDPPENAKNMNDVEKLILIRDSGNIDILSRRIYNFTDNTKTFVKDGITEIQPLNQIETIDKWKRYIEDNEDFFKKLLNQSLIDYNPIKENNEIKYEVMEIDLGTLIIGNNPLETKNWLIRESFKDLKPNSNSVACDLYKLREGIIAHYLLSYLKDYTLNAVQEVIKGVTFFILPIMIDGPTNDEILDALSDDLDKNDIKNSSRYVLLLRHTDELRKNTIVHEAAHTLGLTHTYREEGNDIQPKVFFRKDETKNIMDKGKKFKDNNLFWKWQWETMIKDSDLKPIDNE